MENSKKDRKEKVVIVDNVFKSKNGNTFVLKSSDKDFNIITAFCPVPDDEKKDIVLPRRGERAIIHEWQTESGEMAWGFNV